jgi:hypothetical protein
MHVLLLVRAGQKLQLLSGLIFCYTLIMTKSISVTPKKKRGRPATGRDPHVTARLPQDLIDAIERWAEKGGASRSEAIRRLVEIGLKAKTPK